MSDRKYRYVVAEDEERTREYLARKIAELDPAFVHLASASDGEEAVEYIERYIPDLLVTDIKMPLLDGLALIERIRSTNADMRVLIVSGYSEFEYARRAIELGVDDYLLKPIDLELLREKLRAIRIKLEASAQIVDREYGLGSIGSREEELVKAINLYLKEHLRQNYSLEKLASSFGCKAAYLLRLYNRITGSTPTQEIIKLRIEKAKRMLVSHPDLEIKQIAFAVGYEDPLYFSRLFRRETGQAPTAFRDSMTKA
jgi:YesN/AraC family two-component response regulator